MSTHPVSSGFLLVASPDLLDPNFRQTVVLILHHDDEGSYGLVLNRPLGKSLGDVLPDVDPRSVDVPVLQGGPVQTDMLQFVSGREVGGRVVLPGVVVGVSLEECLESGVVGDGLRAYAGSSGWGAGQLERETSEGSWIVTPGEQRHVFGIPAEELWATVLREMGGEYGWMSLHGGDPGNN